MFHVNEEKNLKKNLFFVNFDPTTNESKKFAL